MKNKQTIKDRLLLTWNLTYPILIIVLCMPVIITLVILLLIIAMIDTYVISILYFIIWIITRGKHYWYVTKKSGSLFGFLINKINLLK